MRRTNVKKHLRRTRKKIAVVRRHGRNIKVTNKLGSVMSREKRELIEELKRYRFFITTPDEYSINELKETLNHMKRIKGRKSFGAVDLTDIIIGRSAFDKNFWAQEGGKVRLLRDIPDRYSPIPLAKPGVYDVETAKKYQSRLTDYQLARVPSYS